MVTKCNLLVIKVTDLDNPTEISALDCSIVASTLDTNNAMKFMSGIEGDLKFGAAPVRSAYFMLSSTEIQPDLDKLVGSGFISQWNYKNCVVLKPLVIDLELAA